MCFVNRRVPMPRHQPCIQIGMGYEQGVGVSHENRHPVRGRRSPEPHSGAAEADVMAAVGEKRIGRRAQQEEHNDRK